MHLLVFEIVPNESLSEEEIDILEKIGYETMEEKKVIAGGD